MNKLNISTSQRKELVDITNRVKQEVSNINVEDGICYLYVPHTTAGIIINEDYDPSVRRDINNKLSEIAPSSANYAHKEGNADSHIKASLVGSSVNVMVENSELVLGKWQGIFFAEFDGPRSRNLYIKIK